MVRFCNIVFASIVMLLVLKVNAIALDFSEVTMDDGTCADGTMLIPKAMAMHCGLSCKDATDADKIDECMNTLAKEAHESSETQHEMIHQLNKEALVVALQSKAFAGNYEEEQDKATGDDSGVQELSAAAGGMFDAEAGSDLRGKQEKNTKLAARSVENMVDIIDVYSSKITLDIIDGFFRYDAPYREFDEDD